MGQNEDFSSFTTRKASDQEFSSKPQDVAATCHEWYVSAQCQLEHIKNAADSLLPDRRVLQEEGT